MQHITLMKQDAVAVPGWDAVFSFPEWSCQDDCMDAPASKPEQAQLAQLLCCQQWLKLSHLPAPECVLEGSGEQETQVSCGVSRE